MEDNSYVSLSLEKYNELYDKAKKYDEIRYKKACNRMFDLLKDYGHTPKFNEESAATEEVEEKDSYYDVELIADDDIPKGAKGKLLEPDEDVPYVDWDENYDCCYPKKIDGVEYRHVFAVDAKNLKKI